jgi:hypothetical protein
MTKQLRQIIRELESCTIITKRLEKHYASFRCSELDSSLTLQVGEKLARSRALEILLQLELKNVMFLHRQKRKNVSIY